MIEQACTRSDPSQAAVKEADPSQAVVKEADPSEAVLKEAEKLEAPYFSGNVAQARAALKAEIRLLEASRVIKSGRQAAVLFVVCARLYALESRQGSQSASELALVKLRYWNLRRYELEGPLTDAGLAEYKSLTPERAIEMIKSADRAMNHGKDPKYMSREP